MLGIDWGGFTSPFSSSPSVDPAQALFETPSPPYGETLDNGSSLPGDFWKNSQNLINTLAGGYATVRRAEQQTAGAARTADRTPVATNTPIKASGEFSITPVAIVAVLGLGFVAWRLTR